jgi:hypothetical protein
LAKRIPLMSFPKDYIPESHLQLKTPASRGLLTSQVLSQMSVNVRPKSVSDKVRATRLDLVDRFEKQSANTKQWYDFEDPQEYRKARAEGTHGFVRPPLNDRARLVYATGRKSQKIELRVIEPPGPSNGVFLHFHAGMSTHSYRIMKPF